MGSTFKINSMKKPTIILSFDDNPVYKSFFEYSVKSWLKYGFDIKVAYITNNPDIDTLNIFKDNKRVNVEIYDIVPNIEIGIQSKLSRLILASETDFFWIMDIDMFILNIEWYHDKFKDAENSLLAEEVYGYGDQKYKWAMSSNMGPGRELKNILNPSNLTYSGLFEFWKTLSNKYDNLEDINKPFKQFSDESFLLKILSDNEIKIQRFKRKEPNWFNYRRNSQIYYIEIMKRIDRTWNWSINREKLKNNQYIDFCPQRPLNTQDYVVKEIFKHLNI